MTKYQNPLLLTVLLLLLSACSGDTPVDKQTRLLNTLQTMETAIEAKKVDDFLEFIKDDFTSSSSGWNKKDIERMLRIRLMKNKSVHVHQAVKEINWLNEGDQQVEIEVVAAMAGTEFSLTDLPTLNADLVKFDVTFQLIDDTYTITKAQWQRANPADFIF